MHDSQVWLPTIALLAAPEGNPSTLYIKMNSILYHKKKIKNFKRMEVVQRFSWFSKLMESSLKSIAETMGKYISKWKLNNQFLNNPWVIEEVSKKVKMYIAEWKQNYNSLNFWGTAKQLEKGHL